MSKRKKKSSRKQLSDSERIMLTTAFVNLTAALINFFTKIIEKL